ncbi:MAG: uroporphyrinogen decarboxylase family protein [Armatimonadetes bacterium]|nr:uroporphyrinogen decarboxylase family protein [Armatimonadota bacterium]
MNAWERTMRSLQGKPADRLPVQPICMTFAARFAGVSYREYVSDYRVLGEAQLRTAEAFDLDIVTLCSDPCREAVDCGAPVRWFDDQPPTHDPNDPFLKKKSDLLALKMPDPLGGGRMHDRVKGVAYLRARAGGSIPVLGWVEGPMAQAADLRGINHIMLDSMDDLEFARDLFEFIVPMEIAFAKAQVEAGADMIGIGDAAASLVGPAFYHEHVYPFEKRIVDAIHEMGSLARLHICGNADHLMDDIARLGVDMIDIDCLTDLSLARRKLGPEMPILGNIDPVSCLLRSIPAVIKAALADSHRIVGNRYIVGPGCEVPPGSPYENVRAMAEYAASASS